MAMKSIHIKVEEDIKNQAEQIFNEIGLPVATALNIFLRKSISCGGFPFELNVDVPNSETIEAMKEADKIACDPNTKKYQKFTQILNEVKEEMDRDV